MQKHTLFFWYKIQYKFFIFLRDLTICIKTRYFFLFFHIFFEKFQRKPGILILDLYLYSIKIQTNINQKW
jgi:hypothetical protein